MSPTLSRIIRHLIGRQNFIVALATVDAFITRETGGEFKALVELNDRPTTSDADVQLRGKLMQRILDALDDESLATLEKGE